jgi:hypothetical protein
MLLKDIIVNTKTVTVEFPGLKGFEVQIAAVSREISRKLKTDSEITKIDPKLRMPVTELDEDKFVESFAKVAIKGWSGFKYSYLKELLLVDESQIENPDDEVDFNLENVVQLLKHSQIFDSWVNDMVFDIERFRE